MKPLHFFSYPSIEYLFVRLNLSVHRKLKSRMTAIQWLLIDFRSWRGHRTLHLPGTSIWYGPYGSEIQDVSEVKFKSVSLGASRNSWTSGSSIWINWISLSLTSSSLREYRFKRFVTDLDYFRQILPDLAYVVWDCFLNNCPKFVSWNSKTVVCQNA